METILPHAITFRTAQSGEYDQIMGFVDEAFGRDAHSSLVHDFPTALGRSNLPHIYLGQVGGELVTAAAALVRTWHTSVGSLRTACLGSFFTPGPFRGRGYNAALQSWMLTELAEEQVDWAVLWSDRPELYRGRGFRPLGRELHGRISDVTWPTLASSLKCRLALPADAPRLLELYQEHPLRAERSVEDIRAHLSPKTSQVLVAEDSSGVQAYAALGKGRDFVGYVHEYGGSPEVVHALWGEAVEWGAHHVLIPEGADRYLGGAAETLPRRAQPSALGRAISGHRLPDDLDSVVWAAWGFDSA